MTSETERSERFNELVTRTSSSPLLIGAAGTALAGCLLVLVGDMVDESFWVRVVCTAGAGLALAYLVTRKTWCLYGAVAAALAMGMLFPYSSYGAILSGRLLVIVLYAACVVLFLFDVLQRDGQQVELGWKQWYVALSALIALSGAVTAWERQLWSFGFVFLLFFVLSALVTTGVSAALAAVHREDGLVVLTLGMLVLAWLRITDDLDSWRGPDLGVLVALLALAAAGLSVFALLNGRFVPVASLVDQGQEPISMSSSSPAHVEARATDGTPVFRYASFGQRLGAYLVDYVVLSIPVFVSYGLVFAFLASPSSESATALQVGLLAMSAVSLLMIVWWCRSTARTGQWVGRRASGTYLVNATTGEFVSAWRVFGRQLAAAPSLWFFGVGYLWMLWDERGQTWHDKIANTVVVTQLPKASTSRPSVNPQYAPTVAPEPFAPEPSPTVAPSPIVVPGTVSPPAEGPVSAPVVEGPNHTVPRHAAVPTDSPVERVQPVESRPPMVRLSDGRMLDPAGMTLIGRDPAAAADDPPGALLSVDDPAVSKTHLAVRCDGDGTVWVFDRNSSNGTSLVRDGEEITVLAGRWVQVHVGDGVRFGASALFIEAPDG